VFDCIIAAYYAIKQEVIFYFTSKMADIYANYYHPDVAAEACLSNT